jgi:hypothetical protein
VIAVRYTIDRSPFLLPEQARAFFEAMKATPEHLPFQFTDFLDDTRRIKLFTWQSRHPSLSMSPASNPSLVGPQYTNPLFSSPSYMLFGPGYSIQTILFRDRRFDACDVTSISCTFQTALYGNDTPFEMYSEFKISKSTRDFRRSYECDQFSLLIFIE